MTNTGAESGPNCMLPEVFQQIPHDFAAYVEANPELLPSYGEFASEAFDIIDRHEDRLVVIEGDHGTGKTTRFIPALLSEGVRKGYEGLGSLSLVGGELEGSDIFLDGHRHMKRNATFSAHKNVPAGYRLLAEIPEHRKIIAEHLRSRFEGTSDGFFVFDEIAGAVTLTPWLVDFVLSEANSNGVRLAAIQPILLGEHAKPFITNAYKCVGKVAAKTIEPIELSEQFVDMVNVLPLLEAIGVDDSFAETLENHTILRRLRVLEHIVNSLLAYRRQAEGDDTIWSDVDVAVALKRRIPLSDHQAFGLSYERYEQVKEILLKPFDS